MSIASSRALVGVRPRSGLARSRVVGERAPPCPSSRAARRAILLHAAASSSGNEGSGDADLDAARRSLQRSMDASGPERLAITGQELKELVFKKWQRSYDVRLQRRGSNMYLHVMWKHLEQKSFPLSAEEYLDQLEAVAAYLTAWGMGERVRTEIAATRQIPGYTVGGGARAVSVRLDVELKGDEWN